MQKALSILDGMDVEDIRAKVTSEGPTAFQATAYEIARGRDLESLVEIANEFATEECRARFELIVAPGNYLDYWFRRPPYIRKAYEAFRLELDWPWDGRSLDGLQMKGHVVGGGPSTVSVWSDPPPSAARLIDAVFARRTGSSEYGEVVVREVCPGQSWNRN